MLPLGLGCHDHNGSRLLSERGGHRLHDRGIHEDPPGRVRAGEHLDVVTEPDGQERGRDGLVDRGAQPALDLVIALQPGEVLRLAIKQILARLVQRLLADGVPGAEERELLGVDRADHRRLVVVLPRLLALRLAVGAQLRFDALEMGDPGEEVGGDALEEHHLFLRVRGHRRARRLPVGGADVVVGMVGELRAAVERFRGGGGSEERQSRCTGERLGTGMIVGFHLLGIPFDVGWEGCQAIGGDYPRQRIRPLQCLKPPAPEGRWLGRERQSSDCTVHLARRKGLR